MLLPIDGNEINDMLDYEFFSSGPKLELALVRGGEAGIMFVWKRMSMRRSGATFEELPHRQKALLPQQMHVLLHRPAAAAACGRALYFKDDDERLSFLFGNYITLTNLNAARSWSVSKKCTSRPSTFPCTPWNLELRVKMMTNRHAGEVLKIRMRRVCRERALR